MSASQPNKLGLWPDSSDVAVEGKDIAMRAYNTCREIAHRIDRNSSAAVARKLAAILHRMWIDGTEFNWSKKEIAA